MFQLLYTCGASPFPFAPPSSQCSELIKGDHSRDDNTSVNYPLINGELTLIFAVQSFKKKTLPNLIKEIHRACRTEVTKFLRFSTHSATLFPDFRSLQGPFPPQNSSELIVELIIVVSHSEYDNHCKGIPIETR